MPMDGINFRDRYCELRWKAAEFLKQKSVINSIKVLKSTRIWGSNLQVVAERSEVERLLAIMNEEYLRRTVEKETEVQPIEQVTASSHRNSLEDLKRLLMRFYSVVLQMRERHDQRPTLDVSDEYDVQDLLHALLHLYFDDIRPEEWTPSCAGKSSRVDFLLRNEAIVVEVKKTRLGLGAKEVGDQLLLDIARYEKMDTCKTLVCLVYDPENRITNPGGLQADLSGQKGNLVVEVLVVPKRY
jgi:hypothetical protein